MPDESKNSKRIQTVLKALSKFTALDTSDMPDDLAKDALDITKDAAALEVSVKHFMDRLEKARKDSVGSRFKSASANNMVDSALRIHAGKQ